MANTESDAGSSTGPALTARSRHANLPVPGEGNKKSGTSLFLPLRSPLFSLPAPILVNERSHAAALSRWIQLFNHRLQAHLHSDIEVIRILVSTWRQARRRRQAIEIAAFKPMVVPGLQDEIAADLPDTRQFNIVAKVVS